MGMREDNKNVPDLIPARMINEYVYCPRLCYLEWVQKEFEHSADTIEGKFSHRRVDESKKIPENLEEEFKATSVYLTAPQVGISTVIDLVEGGEGKVVPIDYKKGRGPKKEKKAYESDKVQICAMGLVLRENNYQCEKGVLYYAGSKKKVEIAFTENLVDKTIEVARKIRRMAGSGHIPQPLEDSPKCPRCSLVGICLPEESKILASSDDREMKEVKRFFPARDDALPVYVQEQGAFVGKKGDELEIRRDGEVVARNRLMETSQLCLFGNVQISTQLIRELCRRDIPICYYSYGGWFNGITHGMCHKNVELRINQYKLALNPDRSVEIARRFIEGKIRNCRTMLRRNSSPPSKSALKELNRLIEVSSDVDSLDKLLGVEGSASRIYFMHFSDMLKSAEEMFFDFESRNRRPPEDPINALLSYAYALLAKETTVTLLAVGFDPYLGFYHRPRYGRPSLALDLMEEFRPLIADSVVISVVNRGEMNPKSFTKGGNSVTLTSKGKKSLIRAYERRMDSLITHPFFGYKISYRRVLEVQARLISKYLSGEIREYPIFCTR